jgi:hypothetical protein
MGVVSAAIRFGGVDLMNNEWVENPLSEVASLVAYILLIVWIVRTAMKAKK